MTLIFYGRNTTPSPAPDTALLTIEQKGVFSFSIAAVQALGLTLATELVLASDVETNAWFVTLQVPAGQTSFELKPRDRKHSKALVFHSLPQARAYWKAHGLTEEKSVRSLVSATAVVQEGVTLYPLIPQHRTVMPKVVEPSAAAEAVTAPEPEPTEGQQVPVAAVENAAPSVLAVEQPVAPEAPVSTTAPASKYSPEQDAALLDMNNSPSDLAREWGVSAAALHTRRGWLKRKAGETVPPVLAAPTAPATPTLIYTPAPAGGVAQAPKTFGLQARAQELTGYWMERDISNTTPGELAEILNLMRHIPEGKRGIEMTLVLDRAETEQTHRLTAAGKGGRRG